MYMYAYGHLYSSLPFLIPCSIASYTLLQNLMEVLSLYRPNRFKWCNLRNFENVSWAAYGGNMNPVLVSMRDKQCDLV